MNSNISYITAVALTPLESSRRILKSAAGQSVEDCDINVEVTKTTTYNTILNFGPYNPYFAAFMEYVLKRTFEKIFSNIRDSSDGSFDFGDVIVTDIKAQQDPSCNTGTWCTEMNLAISGRVSTANIRVLTRVNNDLIFSKAAEKSMDIPF